jgi:diguanylate cyclase
MRKRKKCEKDNFRLKTRILELEALLRDQVKLSREHKRMADFDYLTQIPNRMSFTRALEDMLEDYKNKDYPFTLIYVDLDNFKFVNDNYSHKEGDLVLVEVATKLVIDNRAHTVVGRLGGEEFGLLIPGRIDTESEVIAERVRQSVESMRFIQEDVRVTASIGIYSPEKTDNVDDVIYRADKAMYYSKENGKNRWTKYRDIEGEIEE